MFEVIFKNCLKLWEIFYNVFVFKDLCVMNFFDYEFFFDEVGMDIVKKDKVRWIRDMFLNCNYENLIVDLILLLINFI